MSGPVGPGIHYSPYPDLSGSLSAQASTARGGFASAATASAGTPAVKRRARTNSASAFFYILQDCWRAW